MLKFRTQSGMTLIEIFISLAIVGIVLAFAGPYAITWIQNTQVRNAAESVLAGVQLARIEALKRNTFVSIQLTDPNSTAWTVCLYDPINNVCSVAPGAVLMDKSASEASGNARLGTDTVQGDTTVGIAASAGMPAQLTFDSFGRPAATAPNNMARVDVRNPTMPSGDERRLVILIGVGGQIRMCDPALSKAVNPQGCV